MAWKTAALGVLLLLGTGFGCQKPCLLDKDDLNGVQLPELPPHLECDPNASLLPMSSKVPPPTTVSDPTRNPRYISLREAIAIALEQGTVGSQSPTAAGVASDNLVGFGGGAVSDDSIRVLALDPAITATNIEVALSKFDVQWNTSLTWTSTETPTGASATSTPTAGALPFEAINNRAVNFATSLAKPLPTGGVAGVTFTTNYLNTNSPSAAVNPSYQPDLQFAFEQPLLQGFGVEINQLLPAHPGNDLFSLPLGGQVEGILITRIRLDEQRAEFARNVNFLLLNVEGAYWNLYNAYYQLFSSEEGMREAFELWRLNQLLLERGRGSLSALSQARVQYETFRGQRLTALGQVLERERQLRGLLNLPIEDGFRLVPVDKPTLAPFYPDWETALAETLAKRPELAIAREDLKVHQLDLIRLKNNLLPDLRFLATYDIHSLGSQIDEGPKPQNAFHDLVSDPFADVSLGLRLSVPLGYRAAHAAVRTAELNLAGSYTVLRTEEDKAQRFLGLAYRQIPEFQAQYLTQEAAVEAATEEVRSSLELYQAGRVSQDTVILAQRDLTTAIGNKFTAIAQYNNALATFEFAKGTLMERDSVFIAEGPLPGHVQVRAVEHERERTEAIVLREREGPSAPVVEAAAVPPGQATVEFYGLPTGKVTSLPALIQNRPPLPRLPSETDHPPTPAPNPQPTEGTPAAPLTDSGYVQLPSLQAGRSRFSP